jgi:hypothetical protein
MADPTKLRLAAEADVPADAELVPAGAELIPAGAADQA